MRMIAEMAKPTAAQVIKEEKLPDYNRDDNGDMTRMEAVLRKAMAPDAPTYDVYSGQGADFDEWCYTEGMGCLIAQTQSIEINARLMIEAAGYDDGPPEDRVTPLLERLDDKWKLRPLGESARGHNVLFPPGGNAIWIMNTDNVRRAFAEDSTWMVKPHPVTTQPDIREMKLTFGVTRLYDPNCSGLALLRDAERVGYTTASELGMVAMMLGKPTVDFSSFRYECLGRYHAFYLALRHYPQLLAADVLNRILACPWSGVVPLTTESQEANARFGSFKTKSVEIREHYRPLVPHIPAVPRPSPKEETDG